MTERFTGKVSGRNMVSNGIYGMMGKCGRYFVGEAIDKLAEYETVEEERRSVVFPCKSGQDLFGIYNGEIVEGYADGYLMEKTSVHSDSEHWIWFQDKYSRDFWKVSFNDFGKMVFFTREESEKALKEMKKSNAAN